MAADKDTPDSPETKNRKKNRSKTLLKVFSWLLVMFFLLVLFLFACRNVLMAAAIRNIVPKIIGTGVELEDFSTTPAGAVYIRNLKICNPPGYSQPHLLKISSFYIKLDLPSWLGSMPVIETLESSGINFNYEFNRKGVANIDVLQQNVDNFFGPPQEIKEPEKSGASRSVFIRRLKCTDMSVQSGALKLPLPDIALENLGGTSSLRLALRECFGPLISSVCTAGNSVSNGFSTISNAGQELLRSGVNAGTNIQKRVVNLFNTNPTKEKK